MPTFATSLLFSSHYFVYYRYDLLVGTKAWAESSLRYIRSISIPICLLFQSATEPATYTADATLSQLVCASDFDIIFQLEWNPTDPFTNIEPQKLTNFT